MTTPQRTPAWAIDDGSEPTDLQAALEAVVADRTDGLLVCDVVDGATQRVVHASDAFCALAGTEPDALRGQALSTVLLLAEGLVPANRGQGDGEILVAGGARVPVHVRWLPVEQVDAPGLTAVTVKRWREAPQDPSAALHHAANHDSLTGLSNRDAFFAISPRRWAGEAGQVALVLIDLDRFKVINDTHGHGCGDELLVAVAGRLRSSLDADDVIARLGGDEFVVAGLVTGPAEALSLADRIRLALINQPFRIGSNRFTVTASIGVALGDPTGSTDSLLRAADTAMYAAKYAGRNRIRLFDDELRTLVHRRREVASRLRVALEGDELEVHYQPAWDLRTGQLRGAEALLRWPGGAMGPEEFIPIAEESDLISSLGGHVLDTVCRQVRDWRRQRHPVRRVWVNVSPHELTQPAFARRLLDTLAACELEGPEIGLEVTEQSLRADADNAARQLAFLRAAGIPIAIDDFGTGYSSLAYITDFAPDCIKIDRSFIEQLDRSRSSRSIVATIVHLAHSVAAVSLAEGVETPGQLAILSQLGCDAVAGYLLCPPGPAPDVPMSAPPCLQELCATAAPA